MNTLRTGSACLAALAALFAFFIVAGSFSQTIRPGEDSYKKGMALANQYDCVRAIEEFDRAINASPKDARYFTARAKCRNASLANLANTTDDRVAGVKILAEMDADLSEAIKVNGNYAPAFLERGKLRGRFAAEVKRDPDSVVRDFDRAVELEPDNLEFLRERAHFLLIDLKNEKRGLEDMVLLIKREPKEPGHLFVKGRFFIETGRFPEAIRDLSMALKLEPSDNFARVLRARAYFKSNNYDATLADLNTLARDLDTEVSVLDGIWVLETRAIIYRKQGKKALAAADERRLKRFKRELDINDPE